MKYPTLALIFAAFNLIATPSAFAVSSLAKSKMEEIFQRKTTASLNQAEKRASEFMERTGNADYAFLILKIEMKEKLSKAETAKLKVYDLPKCQSKAELTYCQAYATLLFKEASDVILTPVEESALQAFRSGGSLKLAQLAAREASGEALSDEEAAQLATFKH